MKSVFFLNLFFVSVFAYSQEVTLLELFGKNENQVKTHMKAFANWTYTGRQETSDSTHTPYLTYSENHFYDQSFNKDKARGKLAIYLNTNNLALFYAITEYFESNKDVDANSLFIKDYYDKEFMPIGNLIWLSKDKKILFVKKPDSTSTTLYVFDLLGKSR